MIFRAPGANGFGVDPGVASGIAADAESLKVWGNRQIFPANVSETALIPSISPMYDELNVVEIQEAVWTAKDEDDEL